MLEISSIENDIVKIFTDNRNYTKNNDCVLENHNKTKRVSTTIKMKIHSFYFNDHDKIYFSVSVGLLT